MATDYWIQAALTDDSLVAQVLLLLKYSDPSLLKLPIKDGAIPAPKLEWSGRQRRSKTVSPPKKKGDEERSPTTPLSMSGATSVSGGVEESSEAVQPSDPVRSKQISQKSGTKTPSKRSKRKKTLAELKEEETRLLKERNTLQTELERIRVFFEEQRATNIALKKMKAELQSTDGPCEVAPSSPRCSSKREESNVQKDGIFPLPDLNIALGNQTG